MAKFGKAGGENAVARGSSPGAAVPAGVTTSGAGAMRQGPPAAAGHGAPHPMKHKGSGKHKGKGAGHGGGFHGKPTIGLSAVGHKPNRAPPGTPSVPYVPKKY